MEPLDNFKAHKNVLIVLIYPPKVDAILDVTKETAMVCRIKERGIRK